VKDKRPGRAMSSDCFRPGRVYLLSNQGEEGLYATVCKTWRCKGCRDRMMSLFKARVVIGCSILGRCAFITVTYKEGSPRLAHAQCVAKDWKELWRRLDPQMRQLKWLRVMELTKKRTPHFHLVAGTISHDTEIACWEGDVKTEPFMARWDSCFCVGHRFSRAWYGLTGDSWVVHAKAVFNGPGAGNYMAKYLRKTFGQEDRAKELGMKRRWSSSRGWPGAGRMRLEPSLTKDWNHRDYKGLYLPREELKPGTFTKVGSSPEMIAYFAKKSDSAAARRMEVLLA